MKRTLAFRMSMIYGVVFTLSFSFAFLTFYLFASATIEKHRDDQISGELDEYGSFLAARSFEELKAALIFETRAHGVERVFCRIVGVDGEIIFTSEMDGWHAVAVKMDVVREVDRTKTYHFETLSIPDRSETLRVVYGPLASGKVMQWGLVSTEEDQFLSHARTVFLVQLLLIVLLTTSIGWFVTRKALGGVEEVTRIAESIAAKGELTQRVAVVAKDIEVERLANTFNNMLDRICSLVGGVRDVTDNMAHDLKSPITRIRSMAEITLSTGMSIGEYQTLAVNVIEESDNLLATVNSLLDIAEAASGAGGLRFESVDAADLLRDACDLFEPLIENKHINLILTAPKTCPLLGDLKKLQRMAANLLDNAIKYTPNEGEIEIVVKRTSDAVEISIGDTGIGISQEDLPKICDRFYRCDQSRSLPGAGLGLNLAFTIAQSHGGSIHVESSLGKGSVFTVRLPASQSMMVRKVLDVGKRKPL